MCRGAEVVQHHGWMANRKTMTIMMIMKANFTCFALSSVPPKKSAELWSHSATGTSSRLLTDGHQCELFSRRQDQIQTSPIHQLHISPNLFHSPHFLNDRRTAAFTCTRKLMYSLKEEKRTEIMRSKTKTYDIINIYEMRLTILV